jgi:hypothetical protein
MSAQIGLAYKQLVDPAQGSADFMHFSRISVTNAVTQTTARQRFDGWSLAARF